MSPCRLRRQRACACLAAFFGSFVLALAACSDSNREAPNTPPSGSFPKEDAGEDVFHACAGTAVTAVTPRADVFLVVDRSGSMYGPKWEAVADGASAFLSDPRLTRVGAAMTFFPPRGVTVDYFGNPSRDYCAEPEYPARLETLPDGAPVLIGRLLASRADQDDFTSPLVTNTPLGPAIANVLAAARRQKADAPDHEVVAVLLSDGLPTACDPRGAEQIARLTKEALDEGHVRTYAVGMQGASPSFLTQIAKAGGTDRPYDIGADGTLITKLLANILWSTTACSYELPSPPSGQMLDPTKVNVDVERAGRDVELVGAVGNEAECGDEKGWHYDDPAKPSRVVLCPASCEGVQNDSTVKVNVLFGCETTIR